MSTTSFNWSTPLTLSSATLNSSDPQIAIDPNGNIVAVWVENALIKSSSKPFNNVWTSVVTLSSTNSSLPNLVIDNNGTATALWLENGIVKTSSKILAGVWLPSIALSSTGATSPNLAIDTVGNLVAVWVRAGNVESSTKLFGVAWQSKVNISSTLASSPRVAIGGSGANTRAVVVWHSTSTNLVYASTKLLTGSWSAQLAISDANHTSAYANIAVDSNANATAIWYCYTLTGNIYSGVTLKSSCRPNTTGVWSNGKRISSAGIRNPADLSSRIKYDGNGNAIAIWTTSFDGTTFNVQSAIKPVRSNWSSVMEMVNSLYSYKADLDVNSIGNALSALMFHNGKSLLVLTSEINISGYDLIDWSVPVNVSLGTNNGFPRLATSINGNNINAVVAWMQSNGSNNVIQVSVGSQAIVLPPSNLSITQNNNNFGIFTEYYNTLNWTASTDPNVAGYAIFRNGMFLKQIPSNSTKYVDNNQTQNGSVVYGIATIDNQQAQSKIINANFP